MSEACEEGRGCVKREEEGSAVATPKRGTWNAESSASKIDNFKHVYIAHKILHI